VTPGAAVATAVAFTWLGMVLAISFLEAPLKFRAPGVSVPLGLGIGRLVFRALNAVEVVLAAALITAAALSGAPARGVTAAAVVTVVLVVQVAGVRPRLSRRTDRILARADAPRSRGHLAYIGLEAVKVAALIVTGVLLLSA
jgi:hypothetical protein